MLFQGKREVFRADLREPQQLCDLLNLFYAYSEPDIADFEQAIDEFKQRVPELARGLADIIRDSHDSNRSSADRLCGPRGRAETARLVEQPRV